jgi:hypothetical protein
VDIFWIHTASNQLATIVGVLLVALIALETRLSLWHQTDEADTAHGNVHANAHGNAPDNARRRVDDSRRRVDDDRPVIETNLSRSQHGVPSSQTATTDGDAWVAVAACVLATGLFIFSHELLFWLTVGIALGLLVTLVRAARRTVRLRLWNRAAIFLIVEVALSLAAAVLAWVGVASLSWHGTSMGHLSERVSEAATANQPDPGFVGALADVMVDPALQLIRLGFQDQTLLLVVTLMGAVLLSTLTLVWSWLILFDWLAYVGFIDGQTTKKRLMKRALRFERRSWSGVWAHVVVCGIVALCSTGLLLASVDEGLAVSPV